MLGLKKSVSVLDAEVSEHLGRAAARKRGIEALHSAGIEARCVQALDNVTVCAEYLTMTVDSQTAACATRVPGDFARIIWRGVDAGHPDRFFVEVVIRSLFAKRVVALDCRAECVQVETSLFSQFFKCVGLDGDSIVDIAFQCFGAVNFRRGIFAGSSADSAGVGKFFLPHAVPK